MKRFVAVLSLVFCLIKPSFGKIYVDIRSPGVTKVGIALRFQGEKFPTIETVLKKDLLAYGMFRIYPVSLTGFTNEDLRLIGVELLADMKIESANGRLILTLNLIDTGEGKQLVSKLFEGSENAALLIAHKVADTIYSVVTGENGMFTYPAVAVRKVAGGYELCMLDVGARLYKRVLFSNRPIQSPVLSPDGGRIAFSLMRRGDFDIYVLNVKTAKYKKVCGTSGPDTAPFWSPDGKSLVFSGYVGDNPELFLCDVKTGKIKRITRSIGIETSPSFSPDGKRIVFVSNRAGRPNIYIMDIETGRTVRISSGYYDVSPEWSPKGDAIVYSSVVEGNYLLKLYYIDSGLSEVVGVGEDPTWSPNGNYILFKRLGGLFLKSIYGSDELKIFSGRWENPFWR